MLKTIRNYILIIMGAFIFIFFIWIRFIRERLPKDLPFNLSWLGFFILLYICLIYIYIIYKLLSKNNSSNKVVENIVEIIYEPLKKFDEYIKNLPYINQSYKSLSKIFYIKLSFIVVDTNILFIVLRIIPRFILLSVLFTDIFIFYKLFYIYKIILVGLLIIFAKYLKYSLKYYYEQLIQEYENLLDISMESEHASNIVEIKIPNEDEVDENYFPLEVVPIPLEKFIDYQSELYFEGKKEYPCFVYLSLEGIKLYKKNNNNQQEISAETAWKLSNDMGVFAENSLKELLNLKLLILSFENASNNEYIKNLSVLIYLNYLLCWLYILIISLHTLDIMTFLEFLKNFHTVKDPFSDIFLI